MQKLMNDKIGITYESVNSSKKADIGRVDRPLSADERQYFQNMVNKIYDDFLTRVSIGRNITKEIVDSIGQGRVWTATDAKNIGLVDVIGGLDKAIEIAAFKAGISDYGIENLPKVLSPIERIAKNLNGMETSYIKSKLGKNYGLFQSIEKLNNLEGIQMMLPYEIKID
jgi:protease-4